MPKKKRCLNILLKIQKLAGESDKEDSEEENFDEENSNNENSDEKKLNLLLNGMAAD